MHSVLPIDFQELIVFSLLGNRKKTDVGQSLQILVNRSISSQHTAKPHEIKELRTEVRHQRLLPLLITPLLATEAELVEHLGPAITHNVSDEGLSIISYGKISTTDILTVVCDENDVSLLHCEIRHAQHIGFGYWQRGVRVNEVLRWGPFAKLRNAVDCFLDAFREH